MSDYTVVIDDNYRFMDCSARVTREGFASLDDALAFCKFVVDRFLAEQWQPGQTFSELWDRYRNFGGDPWVLNQEEVNDMSNFSAWEYARQRCVEICGPGLKE